MNENTAKEFILHEDVGITKNNNLNNNKLIGYTLELPVRFSEVLAEAGILVFWI